MSSTPPPPRYYVYILAYPDDTPFYVGKGRGRRMYDHEYDARKGHVCDKCVIIRKIWEAGGEIRRHTVLTTDDETEAHAYEMELIAFYGRHTLVNLTDGGAGTTGRVHSAATRKRQSDGVKARYRDDPDYRQRVLDRLEAWRRNRVNASQRAKEVSNYPGERDRRSEQAKSQWENTDLRSKVNKSLRSRWDDPEYRARISAKAKAFANNPEERARRSERMKALNAKRREQKNAAPAEVAK